MQNDTYYNDNLSKRKKLLIVVICGTILIVGLIIALIAIASNNSSDEDETVAYLVTERENTPMLQTYAVLKNEMRLEELKQAVEANAPNAQLIIRNDGMGYFQEPDGKDYLAFYFEPPIDTNAMEKELEGIDTTEEAVNEAPTIDYNPEIQVYDIRYVYAFDDSEDSPLSISYSQENGMYEVFNLDDVFTFSTRQEAIEAYLAPIAVIDDN